MTKSYCKPPARIDQAVIIKPDFWQNQNRPIKKEKTWQEQLKITLDQKPQSLEDFYTPLQVKISYLPVKILYDKTIEDMQFLKRTNFKKFESCVRCFDKQYKEIFYTTNSEIFQFKGVWLSDIRRGGTND